jgi:nitrate reductase NapAB chaperone NapD
MADTIGDTMTNVWDKITQVKPLPNVKSTNLVNNQNNDDSSNDANAKATDKTVAATKQLNH